jgi:hypothetical protein
VVKSAPITSSILDFDSGQELPMPAAGETLLTLFRIAANTFLY